MSRLKIKHSLVTLVTCVLASSVLVACGDKAKTAVSVVKEGAKEVVSSVSENPREKWNAYVDAYNQLKNKSIRTRSPYLAQLEDQRLAQEQQGDFKKISSSSNAESDIRRLETALSKKGSISDVDQVAQELVTTLKASLPNWKLIEEYNRARRYEDDNGAKGNELMVEYLKNLKANDLAYAKFSDAVDKESVVQNKREIEEYKARGELVELHTKLSLTKAEALLNVFGEDPTKAVKNSSIITNANEVLKELETELDLLKAELEKEKAKNSAANLSRSEDVHRNLSDMAGNYRAFRKDASSNGYNNMVNSYNSGVSSANRRY